jgi:hypothetical protein
MPSVRALRRLSAELDSIDDWGDRAASAYRLASNDDEQFLWAEHVRRVLSGIGGIDGRGEREPLPALLQSSRTFEISRRPARDERFSTFSTTRRYASHEQAPWNGNLPPELVEQIRIQRDEIDAIETFANVLHAYSHDSFELVADLSRLVSDEARHAELGHRALEDLGIDPFSVPCSTIGIVVRAQLPPLLAFAQINTFGEINNVGNLRRCARTALGLGQRPLASMFDFIHADELMHIRRGRAWLRQLAGKAGIGELDARARELACARLVAEGIVGEDYALQITDHELSELVGE